MNLNAIEYKILDPRASRPERATSGSAGFDLVACIEENFELAAGAVTLISTGIAIHIKNSNFAGLILPRSGLGHKHGIILGNSVGLIDSDYQGELKVSCWNRSAAAFNITPGLRLAQLVIVPVITPVMREVENFEETARGVQGFGSTGTHKSPS